VKNTTAIIQDIANACSASVPTVSAIKEEMGLRRGSTPAQSPVAASRSAPAISEDDSADHLREAIKLASSYSGLIEILDHVEAAGGIQSFKESLKQYERLQAFWGR
jgi:hypothetical protein